MKRWLLALFVLLAAASLRAVELGGLSRGTTWVAIYLPVEQRTKNVSGRDGLGLCVFSSIGQASRYQNVPQLKDFQKWMRSHPGGGFPSKVDKMIAAYCQEQGVGPPAYLQYQGTDVNVVRAVIESGRMPSVTYDGRDPHYRMHVEHMVNVVGFSDEWVCVLDNNFVESDAHLVWLTPAEFKDRWIGGKGRQGWLVVLLGSGWPPECPPLN